VALTPADEPIVAAIAVIELAGESQNPVVSQARLALTGAWRENARLARAAELLAGKPLTEEAIEQIAIGVEQEVSPPDDFRGSANYRRAMAALLTRRALRRMKKQG